jgi:peptidyl-tRNA hydrolase, PTH1 family
VIGLGNPGSKYSGTRHNIGFHWVDEAIRQLGVSASWKERFHSEWCSIDRDGHELHFLKPLTFMNESGRAWAAFREKFQGELRTLTIYDDLDLGLGELRYRLNGSDGGHRGLRSLLQLSGGFELERLRVGIGRSAEDAADFVLSRFRPEEKEVMEQVLEVAGEHLALILRDTTKAMNALNAWKPKRPLEVKI